mmetsp:Transcript_38338/g.105614  ORF Transcript_38338/g.105614 Transcript_38338/m.105614 type:complete len:225 (+) Transcript_38338:181-855(+)
MSRPIHIRDGQVLSTTPLAHACQHYDLRGPEDDLDLLDQAERDFWPFAWNPDAAEFFPEEHTEKNKEEPDKYDDESSSGEDESDCSAAEHFYGGWSRRCHVCGYEGNPLAKTCMRCDSDLVYGEIFWDLDDGDVEESYDEDSSCFTGHAERLRNDLPTHVLDATAIADILGCDPEYVRSLRAGSRIVDDEVGHPHCEGGACGSRQPRRDGLTSGSLDETLEKAA